MSIASLSRVYTLVKNIEGSSVTKLIEDKNRVMTIELTMRIANACQQENEFIEALLDHKYPPIRLTQIEAEFLKTGSLPEILVAEPELFQSA